MSGCLARRRLATILSGIAVTNWFGNANFAYAEDIQNGLDSDGRETMPAIIYFNEEKFDKKVALLLEMTISKLFILDMPKINEVQLVIDCNGGNISAGITLFNILSALPKSRGVKLKTFNMANVDSAGTLLFLAGSERKASPNASFLFHGGYFDNLQHVTESDSLSATKSISYDNQRMRDIYKVRTKLTDNQLQEIFSRDVAYTPLEAIRFGISDGIQEFDFPKGKFVVADSMGNIAWPDFKKSK